MTMILKMALATVAVAALSSTAMAADLMIPAKAAPVVAAATSWDGAYIGVNGGYGWGNSDHNDIVTTTGDFPMSGGFVGGQIGYNFHLTDGVVAGIQGDFDWANITGSVTTFPAISDTLNWTGSVTAHLGFDTGANIMPYILGGVAFANSSRTDLTSVTVSKVHTGYTLGAGVEGMLTSNVSAFAEYRYNNYGSQTYTGLASTPGVGITDSEVRVGLNYHF